MHILIVKVEVIECVASEAFAEGGRSTLSPYRDRGESSRLTRTYDLYT